MLSWRLLLNSKTLASSTNKPQMPSTTFSTLTSPSDFILFYLFIFATGTFLMDGEPHSKNSVGKPHFSRIFA
jgi:hypothetical protein